MPRDLVDRALWVLVVLGLIVAALSAAWAVDDYRVWRSFALPPTGAPTALLTVDRQDEWMFEVTRCAVSLVVALAASVLLMERRHRRAPAVQQEALVRG